MADKLSERLEAHADAHASVSPYDEEQAQWERDLREAAELARRVEGAAVVYVNRTYDCNAGEDRGEVLDTVPVSLAGQRVRLVPEDGQGGG